MLDWALGFIGGLLYPLFSIIFVCIDGVQGLFYAMAGIGDMHFGAAQNGGIGSNWGQGQQITSGNSGGETDTGIIYFLFQNSLVKNLLISIMLLALFLIIIFTVMAFIKNAYAAKQKGWKEIIGNSIKGLFNFIFLPIVCLLGVWLANILLQAINGATSGGGTTQMSRKLFISSAYNANSCRGGVSDSEAEEIFFKRLDDFKRTGANNLDGTEYNWNFQTGGTAEYYANCIDQIYANTNISIYEWGVVEVGYSLWEINYLVLIVGGIFMLYALGSLAFGMVRRIFLLLILFVISPGVCALYPLDEGKAVQSWSGEVKKQVLSVHGSVAAINIFFALLPLIDKLHFTGPAGSFAGIDDLIQIFILTSGLMCVKEFTGLLSGFIGGEDAYGKASGQLKSAASSIGKKALGAVAVGSFVKNNVPGVAKGLWNAGKAGGSAVSARLKAGSLMRKDKKDQKTAAKDAEMEKYRNKLTPKQKAEMTSEGLSDWEKQHKKAENYFKSKDKKAQKIADKEEDRARKISKIAAKNSYGKGGYSIDEKGVIHPNEQGREYAEARRVREQAKRDAKRVAAENKAEKKANKEATKKAKQERRQSFYDASGYSDAKNTLKSAGGELWGAVKNTGGAIYEETGMKDKVGQVKKAWTSEKDKREARDKKKKEGSVGEKDALNNLQELLDLNETVGIDSMSSEVIRALGDSFGEAVAKKLFKGELSNEDGSTFKVEDLGLNKNSSIEDISNMDSILNKLMSYEDRINSALDKGDTASAKAIARQAADFARSADANGNKELQKALDSALSSFIQAQKGQKIKLDENTVKVLADASREAGKAMAKAMKEQTKELVAAVLKKQKKDN